MSSATLKLAVSGGVVICLLGYNKAMARKYINPNIYNNKYPLEFNKIELLPWIYAYKESSGDYVHVPLMMTIKLLRLYFLNRQIKWKSKSQGCPITGQVSKTLLYYDDPGGLYKPWQARYQYGLKFETHDIDDNPKLAQYLRSKDYVITKLPGTECNSCFFNSPTKYRYAQLSKCKFYARFFTKTAHDYMGGWDRNGTDWPPLVMEETKEGIRNYFPLGENRMKYNLAKAPMPQWDPKKNQSCYEIIDKATAKLQTPKVNP